MNKEKKYFAGGMLAGCLTGLLVPVLVVGLIVFFLGVSFNGRGNTDEEEAYYRQLESKLAEIQACIDEHYVFEYDREELTDMLFRGYVAGLGDPYSAYYTAEEYADTMEAASGEYYGIGVLVSQDPASYVISVVNVFKNSPAMEAGLQTGDVLIAVEGEDITAMALDAVVPLIKGEEGSFVSITVYRPESRQELTLPVERRRVEVDTVSCRMLDETTGYLALIEYDSVSPNQVRSAIGELTAGGMERLILDLRDNPGGLLDSVLAIADFFLEKDALIFYMEDKQGREYRFNAKEEALFSGELIVLINGNSASAAEVLSGALKDHDRATLMGETSFGKGIVQSYLELSDGSALKLTTEHYCTPDGSDIHGRGIEPHIEGRDDPATRESDELLEAALAYWKNEA